MTHEPYDFSIRVELVASLGRFLSEHRHIIGGPRTLAQAFVNYRRLLMDGSIRLRKLEDESIRHLNPDRVNWLKAYDWWEARDKKEHANKRKSVTVR